MPHPRQADDADAPELDAALFGDDDVADAGEPPDASEPFELWDAPEPAPLVADPVPPSDDVPGAPDRVALEEALFTAAVADTAPVPVPSRRTRRQQDSASDGRGTRIVVAVAAVLLVLGLGGAASAVFGTRDDGSGPARVAVKGSEVTRAPSRSSTTLPRSTTSAPSTTKAPATSTTERRTTTTTRAPAGTTPEEPVVTEPPVVAPPTAPPTAPPIAPPTNPPTTTAPPTTTEPPTTTTTTLLPPVAVG